MTPILIYILIGYIIYFLLEFFEQIDYDDDIDINKTRPIALLVILCFWPVILLYGNFILVTYGTIIAIDGIKKLISRGKKESG
jgi:hypothetical protein